MSAEPQSSDEDSDLGEGEDLNTQEGMHQSDLYFADRDFAISSTFITISCNNFLWGLKLVWSVPVSTTASNSDFLEAWYNKPLRMNLFTP